MMEAIWNNFDRVVVFDTETTGIEFGTDCIIELGAVSLEKGVETDCMDLFIRLPEGQTIPPFITELTGITDARLLSEGVDQGEAVEAFCRLLEGAERPLLVAYNAQFDLNFLYWFLRPCGRVGVLRAPRFLDALTVYRDRRDYPHKLCNAIEAYGLLTGWSTATVPWTTPGPPWRCWRPWRRSGMTWSGIWTCSASIPSMGCRGGKFPPSPTGRNPTGGRYPSIS